MVTQDCVGVVTLITNAIAACHTNPASHTYEEGAYDAALDEVERLMVAADDGKGPSRTPKQSVERWGRFLKLSGERILELAECGPISEGGAS